MVKNRHRIFRSKNGFTMIELMIVVAVIALIALMVLPKMNEMIRKSNEAGTKAQLGSVRAAIRLYYMDQDQVFPTDILVLMQPGSLYLKGAVPALYTVEHGTLRLANNVPSIDPAVDTGGWGYVSLDTDPDHGSFWIQCTHRDLKGKRWSDY